MSESPLSDSQYDAITDTAAHWCMRLQDGDMTVAERKALQTWLQAHPQHAVEFEAIAQIWNVTGLVQPVSPPPTTLTPPAPSRRRRHRYAAAAAVILSGIPLTGLVGWQFGWLPNAYETHEAQGGTHQVLLSDGSRVQLNLNTHLTFTNYKDRRSVRLDNGEAFFEVSHDRQHPFVVNAGEGSIRVTGTRFNVWMYNDQVKVMLVEGSVKVTSKAGREDNALTLLPNMQASWSSGDNQPRVSPIESNDTSMAWREGKLVINDLPLNQALPLINRYLQTPIVLADNATGQIRLGGIFNTQEMASLATSLPGVLPVSLSRNQQGNPVINRAPTAKATP